MKYISDINQLIERMEADSRITYDYMNDVNLLEDFYGNSVAGRSAIDCDRILFVAACCLKHIEDDQFLELLQMVVSEYCGLPLDREDYPALDEWFAQEWDNIYLTIPSFFRIVAKYRPSMKKSCRLGLQTWDG